MPDTYTETLTDAPLYRNRSSEIAKLAVALCKAQGQMDGARKDSTNPHFKNAYADLASVWDAVRKPLTDNGLSIVQFPRTRQNGVEIETTLLHSSGEFMCDVLWVPCSKNDAQGMGSAITYGRRYALMAVTGIAPVDDDGNAASKGTGHVDGPGTSWGPGGKQSAIDDAKADGLMDNAPRVTDAVKTRAKARVDKDIATFKLSGQTTESLGVFWKANAEAYDGIKDRVPDEYARLEKAYIDALDAAEARAG